MHSVLAAGAIIAARPRAIRTDGAEDVGTVVTVVACHPSVKTQKNDHRDAEAIAAAATRPTMRFVELKSEQQLDMQRRHRARDRLVGERTALINQLRAFLLECGIIVPQGRQLERHIDVLLVAEHVAVSLRTRMLIEDQRAEWRQLHRRILGFDEEFALQAQADETARLLNHNPGYRTAERNGDVS
jgi:transposase